MTDKPDVFGGLFDYIKSSFDISSSIDNLAKARRIRCALCGKVIASEEAETHAKRCGGNS